MGNCCSGQHPSSSSPVNWDGDDWESVKSKCRRKNTILFEEGGEGNALTSSSSSCNPERQKLLGFSSSGSSSLFSSLSTDGALIGNNPQQGEIKIKISKKELEKLMEAIDTQQQDLNVKQVLSRLMKANMNGYHEYHEMGQHQWRPVLQSIPELN